MPKYILYGMDEQPTPDNRPVGMNSILGWGEYANERVAMRYLRPKLERKRDFMWLGLYDGMDNVAHKERS